MKAIDIKEIKLSANRCLDLMEILNLTHKGSVEDKFALMVPVVREFYRVANAAKISDLCDYMEHLQAEAEKPRDYREGIQREIAIRSDIQAVLGGPHTVILPKPVMVHIDGKEKIVIPLKATLTELTRLGHPFCYEGEDS